MFATQWKMYIYDYIFTTINLNYGLNQIKHNNYFDDNVYFRI